MGFWDTLLFYVVLAVGSWALARAIIRLWRLLRSRHVRKE